MDRRNFLKLAAAAPWIGVPGTMIGNVAFAAAPAGADYRNLVVLIELKGGNDGLNTLVPYASRTYYALRPKLAIPRGQDGAALIQDFVTAGDNVFVNRMYRRFLGGNSEPENINIAN